MFSQNKRITLNSFESFRLANARSVELHSRENFKGEKIFGSGSALVTPSPVDKAQSASLANKALLFVEALRPIAPCSGTSALSAFVKRFTPTELCKLFPRLPFGPEKLALT